MLDEFKKALFVTMMKLLKETNAKFDAKIDTASLDATKSYHPMPGKYIYLTIGRIILTW